MHEFSSFGIVIEERKMVGDKIEIYKVLNLPVSVLDYEIKPTKIEDNKTKGNGMCLKLQIDLKGVKRVIFTSSVKLQDQINQAGREKLPFSTTIIKAEDDSFRFT